MAEQKIKDKMLGYSKFLLPLHRQSPDGEMVDALVSGASVERRVGSSPILGTSGCQTDNRFFYARIGLGQLVAPRQSYLRLCDLQSCYATVSLVPLRLSVSKLP